MYVKIDDLEITVGDTGWPYWFRINQTGAGDSGGSLVIHHEQIPLFIKALQAGYKKIEGRLLQEEFKQARYIERDREL